MRRVLFKEVFRKFLHAPFVTFAFLAREFPSHTRVLEVLLISIGVFYYMVEQLRLQKRTIPVLSHVHNIALRQGERNQFAYAPLTLFIGMVLVLEFYILPVASAAIISVTIGDTAASIGGLTFSSTPHLPWNKKKTYVGMLANALSVFIVCFLFFRAWKIALITSIASALVESLDLEHVDNLIIPLFVGMILYLTIV